ncbi:MAG: YARHG domain-containing protein [Eubacteriales bacterium]|nr:YARHG domain-containing protein [Eubacteriales bacterium]
MKNGIKKAFLSAAITVTGAAMTVQAAVPDGIWNYSEAYDDDNNAIYDFTEIEVMIPAEWKGLYGFDIFDDNISFYQIKSRDAFAQKTGELQSGGEVFEVYYCQDYSYQNWDFAQVIGSGDAGIYVLTRPGDSHGYEADSSILTEYQTMTTYVDWIAENAVLTSPGEGIADPDNIKEATGTGTSGNQSSSNGYILQDSSVRALAASELNGMNADELQMAINEIYARHGRKFLTKSIQEYFNSKSWYNGTTAAADFKESALSSIEENNIAIMLQCMSTSSKSGGSSALNGSGNTTASAGGTVMAASVTVNIRSKASTNGVVVGIVPQGYHVTVTGSAANGWIPVNYNGITGYIYQDYLQAASGGSSNAVQATSPTATAGSETTETTAEVESTETAETSEEWNTAYVSGTVISTDNEWIHIQSGNVTGDETIHDYWYSMNLLPGMENTLTPGNTVEIEYNTATGEAVNITIL